MSSINEKPFLGMNKIKPWVLVYLNSSVFEESCHWYSQIGVLPICNLSMVFQLHLLTVLVLVYPKVEFSKVKVTLCSDGRSWAPKDLRICLPSQHAWHHSPTGLPVSLMEAWWGPFFFLTFCYLLIGMPSALPPHSNLKTAWLCTWGQKWIVGTGCSLLWFSKWTLKSSVETW